jgi:hypothetical protein
VPLTMLLLQQLLDRRRFVLVLLAWVSCFSNFC